jgi:hypothetical protein
MSKHPNSQEVALEFNMVHPIIQEIVLAGVPVTLVPCDGKVAYSLSGFFREGSLILIPWHSGSCQFKGRLGVGDPNYDSDICTIEDVLHINEDCRVSAGQEECHQAWAPLLIKYGIAEEVKTVRVMPLSLKKKRNY